MSHRKIAATHEPGNLFGVEGVVLGLAAVDGFHVQSVSEQKGNVVVGTPIGQPIPVESRLAGEDEIGLTIGLELGEQEVELIGLEVAMEQFLAGCIDDTDVQAVAM